jgi:hypothetical protein
MPPVPPACRRPRVFVPLLAAALVALSLERTGLLGLRGAAAVYVGLSTVVLLLTMRAHALEAEAARGEDEEDEQGGGPP